MLKDVLLFVVKVSSFVIRWHKIVFMYSVHSDVTVIQICHTVGRSGDRLSKLAELSHN